MDLDNLDPEAMLMEPREYYDKCIVGTTYDGSKVIYDTHLVLQSLMEDQGMTDEEALDWFEYNMLGSYLGEGTPIFMVTE
jgi:hypothetical protein